VSRSKMRDKRAYRLIAWCPKGVAFVHGAESLTEISTFAVHPGCMDGTIPPSSTYNPSTFRHSPSTYHGYS
jgi:hypothetical protein